MAPRIGVVVIHGMGSQERGFSHPLREELIRRLDHRASRFVWQEIYWAAALKGREARLWEAMCAGKTPAGDPIPLNWASIRQFVVHNFGDALAYHRDSDASSTYLDVHRIISGALHALYTELADPAAPLVVMAHSLGAHMMSDYIWDRQRWKGPGPDPFAPVDTLAALVTFGCNIPLFSLEFDVATPIDLPGPDVTKPALRAAARWINFLDRDDVLGWPLKPLYQCDEAALTAPQRDTVARIEDREINVGSFGTAWTPAAHAGYWTDNDFTKPVTAYLASLVQALDSQV